MTGTAAISEKRPPAPPPFLLLATLLFWGWQSGLLIFGAVMGGVLESARFIKIRWDFSTDDFRRLWNFCTLLGFAVALYIFGTHRAAAELSGIHTTTTLARWLPMLLFLFVAAQHFSECETIPLSAISMIVRRRQRNATGPKPEWNVNVSYPYFIVCLFSAGVHQNEGAPGYFWGQCLLLAWALWPLRARRFHLAVWLGVWLLAVALAYSGTRGIGQLEQLAQNYNAQWIARFLRQQTDPTRAMTAIGQIGRLKLSDAIVIRLETRNHAPPPDYLREASYRDYHSPQAAWYAGDARHDFSEISHVAGDETSWILLPEKTNLTEVQIACYLNGWSRDLNAPEGLLPLPSGSARLANLPAISLQMNRLGAVLATGPSLLIFNARYGPGPTFDLPSGVRIPGVPGESRGVDSSVDLAVPTNELPALKQVAQELHVSATASDAQKELAVAHFFAAKFTYRTWQKRGRSGRPGETPLADFLLRTHAGHCEYFATATVLLLRELGIPARYAVGYYVHETDGDNRYVVRERDAHAWCLAWNKKTKTWEDFDTTPASWVATESRRASPMQSVKDFFSWLHFQFSKFRWGQTHWRQYIVWALVPMLAFLLYQIIFRRGRKRRAQTANHKNTAAAWPGADSEFYRLEARLAARGVPRPAGETLATWLERVLAENEPPNLRGPLRELLNLHYRLRFDPNGLNADERKLLAQKTASILKILTMK